MLIGLSGYARVGKNSVAAILVEEFGYKQVALADKLKQALATLNPNVSSRYPIELADVLAQGGWEYAKQYPEVRRLLQVLGTEVGRKMFWEDFWTDLAFREVSPGDKVVFSDVRFPNEADRVKSLGGEIWRITRNDYAPINAHESETALNAYPFDRHINNGRTLEDLRTKIVLYFNPLRR
jgi:hypothetical protein